MIWDEILDENDPNISMNNSHQHINFMLDKFVPYKNLSKSVFKLQSKPWINREILSKMKKRDLLLHMYCETADKDSIASQTI